MIILFSAALIGAALFAGVVLAQVGPPPLPGSQERAAEWFVGVDGQPQGPMTLEELIDRQVADDALVWREGMPDWVAAGELPELAEARSARQEADTTAYYTGRQDITEGPLDRAMMEMRIASGALRGDSLIWYEGLDEWKPLRETKLASLLPELPTVPGRDQEGMAPPLGGSSVTPEGQEPATAPAHQTAPRDVLIGRWEGRIRQPIENLPEPIDIDVELSYHDGGRFSGSGTSIVNLQGLGVSEPVRLDISTDGSWTAEPLPDGRLRLRTNGTMRFSMPALDIPEETETFDEIEIIDLSDPDILHYDDGSTLRRVRG